MAQDAAPLLEGEGGRLLAAGDGVLVCEPAPAALAALEEPALALLERAHERLAAGDHTLLVLWLRAGGGEGGGEDGLGRLRARLTALGADGAVELARRLQAATARRRYGVVAALEGPCLDVTHEVALGAHLRVVPGDLRCGLTHARAHLLPLGGGCLRALLLQDARRNARGRPLGPVQNARAAFDLLASARAATSAEDARRRGLLPAGDVVLAPGEDLLARAVALAVERRDAPWPAEAQGPLLPGRGGELYLEAGAERARAAGALDDRGLSLRRALARVVSGGALASPVEPTSAARVLDLEREALRALLSST